MPANFSAVNAEVVYGGAVADYLPNAWTAANIKKFNTNVITLISNTVTASVLKATLGTMFSGQWGSDGVQLFGDDGSITNLFKYGFDATNKNETNFFNKVMVGLGVAASVYTLGTSDAAVWSVKKAVKADGTV